MEGKRWTTISPLLDELLDLTGMSRARRLAEIEASDPSLAAELTKLMDLEADRPDFMSQPVVDARLFAAQAGQEIGPYRLVAPIGEGGMGQVWLAVRADGLYERRVALKLLRPGLGDVGLHARFTRERQILARLGHAHIARLLDAGISQDGQPYLALDYVRGDPITDYAQKRTLDLRTRLSLFTQVCAAVSHAHANLVVHRDLKPSNILVNSAGEVCLLDFGIAKLLDQDASPGAEITRTGSRTFTLHYAAPEQLRGEVVTTMTDVYALGVVLYELLTDAKPYELSRQSDAAWEEAILAGDPGRPSQVMARRARDSGAVSDKRRARLLAGDLDNIVLKALSKQPEHRYASVEALAQDIRRHLDGQPVQARAQSLGYRVRKYVRRHAVVLAGSVGVTGVLAVALAIVSWQADRAVSEATRAQAMQDFVIALFENSGGTGDGQSVDVRGLLDAGMNRADSELATQPQARAELIGLIARLRSGLGDEEEALRLLDHQQDVLHGVSDVPVSMALASASLRGHSLRQLDRHQECLDALGPLLQPARDGATTDPLSAADFYSQLGRCRAALGQTTQARELFTEARALRRRHDGGGGLVAESETDLATLLIAEGQAAAAVRSLREALGHLRGAGSEQNALGADIWHALGAAFEGLDNPTEAEAAYRQSLAIVLSRRGGQHPRTARVQRALAGVLLGQGRLAEADQMLAMAHDSSRQRWGSNSLQLAEQSSVRGMVALERDQPADAEALLADAVRIWRNRNLLASHAWDLCHLAQSQSAQGRQSQAEAHRRECIALLQAQPSANAVPALAAIVQAALDRGDSVQAQAWLAQMPQQSPRKGPELALIRARMALLAGEPGVDTQLQAVLRELPADREHRRLRWQALSLQAAQHCLNGRAADGLALRQQTLADAQRQEPEHLRQHRSLAQLSAACEAKG